MKKEDLKDGMILEYNSEKKVINIAGNFHYIRNLESRASQQPIMTYDCTINGYNEDLIEETSLDEDRTIRRVYTVKCGFRGNLFQMFDDENLELIWERKEPVKLTAFQCEMLKRIASEYKFLARDRNNKIYMYAEKPVKEEVRWNMNGDNWEEVLPFFDFFDFVKWEDEEAVNIQELLDNCEVVQ